MKAENFLRFLFWISFIITIGIFFPAFTSLLFFAFFSYIIYEIMPFRIAEKQDFIIEVITTLIENGETAGRELREIANRKAGTKIGSVMFYSLMTRLEKHGHVTSRKEGYIIFYKITKSGRRKKAELLKTKDQKGFEGHPAPGPA